MLSERTKLGIYKIYLSVKELRDIMITIFIKEGATNEDDIGTLDIDFKYRTVVQKEDDEKIPYTKAGYKISNSFSTLTSSVLDSKYILTLYQQSDVNDIEKINNVNIKDSPSTSFE